MLARRDYLNIAILAICEAIFMSTSIVNVAIAGLATQTMLSMTGLATLPLATIPVVSMLLTVPAALLMRRIGRPAGFAIGAAAGACSAAICAWALYLSSFPMFLGGIGMMGVYQAFATYYRFAVADEVLGPMQGVAVSLVMAGGLLAAVIGPSIAVHTQNLFAPVTFMGCYIALIGLNAAAAMLLAFLRIEAGLPTVRRRRFDIGLLARDTRIPVAMLFCGIANATMMLVMTVTPLAMLGCGYGVAASGAVISWHVVAMFAPFFFSGMLIRRVGLHALLYCGLVLLALSGVLGMAGTSVPHFGMALVVSGLAWNFMYLGGSTLLAGIGDADERPVIQGMNEFIAFAFTAIGTLASGLVYAFFGWASLNAGVVAISLLLFAILAAAGGRLVRATEEPA